MAARLAHELDAAGIGYILDPELIEGDPFWREAIARFFPECELMVGLVSRHALASPWVEQEQRAFPGHKLWIRLEPAVISERLSKADVGWLVPASRALSAITRALGRRGERTQPRNRAPLISPRAERLRRLREEEVKLESFRAGLFRLPRPRLEILGDIARIGGGFLELRRIPERGAAGFGDTYVCALPVTNAQYRAFLEVANYRAPPTWDRATFRAATAPVTGINWFEACAFASWVGASLLTEADWEHAAHGGEPRRTYATATGQIAAELACFGQRFGGSPPEVATAYPPNAEGYRGMCGNVWDWCATAWGAHRAIRGGGCMDVARFCAIRARYRNAPLDRDCCVGFRVKIEPGRAQLL